MERKAIIPVRHGKLAADKLTNGTYAGFSSDPCSI